MILIQIGVIIYPVKDSAEWGLVFLKIYFVILGIPNKLNRFIVIDILLYSILLCHYKWRLSLSLHSILYQHLWHFPKNGKNWTFGLKSV